MPQGKNKKTKKANGFDVDDITEGSLFSATFKILVVPLAERLSLSNAFSKSLSPSLSSAQYFSR